MKTFNKILISSLTLPILCSCGASAPYYDTFYHSLEHAPTNVIVTDDDQYPTFVEVLDLKRGLDRYKKQGYVPIGYMEFSGGLQKWMDIKKYAKTKGADLILYSQKYTDSTKFTLATADLNTLHELSGLGHNYDTESNLGDTINNNLKDFHYNYVENARGKIGNAESAKKINIYKQHHDKFIHFVILMSK